MRGDLGTTFFWKERKDNNRLGAVNFGKISLKKTRVSHMSLELHYEGNEKNCQYLFFFLHIFTTILIILPFF